MSSDIVYFSTISSRTVTKWANGLHEEYGPIVSTLSAPYYTTQTITFTFAFSNTRYTFFTAEGWTGGNSEENAVLDNKSTTSITIRNALNVNGAGVWCARGY